MITLHSQDGQHFLGLRTGREGGYEIVYDCGLQRRRFVLLIKTAQVDARYFRMQLEDAIQTVDVLTTLSAALRNAAIEFETDYD
ncbi:hypothetical protein [Yoonia vestfoldensis]|uniref:Uncharacterized protein n=1 Tax=Yoonia vestfoldensis SKA53 TaxID=314232 RepID=A3V6Y1_9RHOB|nr:hypothetical protein [Yoonia vestfoldensis]EAQ05997.1 hypothetical protein SKA53_07826 [Yoonia vestfoldensis SKA53]